MSIDDPARPPAAIAAAQEGLLRLIDRIEGQVVGQRTLLERLVIALLAGGHVLIEGVPGLAKTRAVRALARALDLPFRRIQFTPDLLPADLTGTQIYRPATGTFDVRPGPIVTSVLLADEINRAPAKVQSACSRPCRRARSPSATRRSPCPTPSGCWPPRTRSSTRGPIRCPRPSSIGS